MEYILPALAALLSLAAVILCLVLLVKTGRASRDTRLLDELHEEMRLSRGEIRDILRQNAEASSRTASSEKQYYFEAQEARLRALAAGTESIDGTTDGVVISKPAKIYNALGVMS